MRPRIAIIGSGGHARVVLDALRSNGLAGSVWGCLDEDPSRCGHQVDGVPIYGGIDLLCEHRHEVDAVIVAIGSNSDRARLCRLAKDWGFPLARVTHLSAVIAEGVEIGEGTVVMAGTVIQAGASIGSIAIINTGATVDHDCVVEDGVHIAPGVHLGGNVHVGCGSLIGIGASVHPGVTIGEGSVIGVGSAVVRDIPPHVVAFGVPATVRHSAETVRT